MDRAQGNDTTTSLDELKALRDKAEAMRIEPISRRKNRLKKLRAWVHANRSAIQKALYDDFRKPAGEVDAIEIFQVLAEIKNALAHIDLWTSPQEVRAPLTLLGTSSYIQYEPRGICLIMSPWNYPFLLCVGPLVCALAAGNTIVLKPSELTPGVSAIIKRMTQEVFEPAEVLCYEGGSEIAEKLLTYSFDHIFFTGSPAVGKLVMKAASHHLASVTLELGGKCPAIVTKDADLKMAAERIAVGKFVNNGQTCIAPDYVIIDKAIADRFTRLIIESTTALFTSNREPFSESKHYCRIVNGKHFSRLQMLLDDALGKGAEVVLGGQWDPASRFIYPTILRQVSPDAAVLEEEIFGPILPIVIYDNLDEAVSLINKKPKPLALYVFSKEEHTQQQILRSTSSGGACINDCGVHFFHHNLPFGGVNESGMGKSHGVFGFQAFSNAKAVLRQRRGWTTVQAFYPPYTETGRKMMDWLLKFFNVIFITEL